MHIVLIGINRGNMVEVKYRGFEIYQTDKKSDQLMRSLDREISIPNGRELQLFKSEHKLEKPNIETDINKSIQVGSKAYSRCY